MYIRKKKKHKVLKIIPFPLLKTTAKFKCGMIVKVLIDSKTLNYLLILRVSDKRFAKHTKS